MAKLKKNKLFILGIFIIFVLATILIRSIHYIDKNEKPLNSKLKKQLDHRQNNIQKKKITQVNWAKKHIQQITNELEEIIKIPKSWKRKKMNQLSNVSFSIPEFKYFEKKEKYKQDMLKKYGIVKMETHAIYGEKLGVVVSKYEAKLETVVNFLKKNVPPGLLNSHSTIIINSKKYYYFIKGSVVDEKENVYSLLLPHKKNIYKISTMGPLNKQDPFIYERILFSFQIE